MGFNCYDVYALAEILAGNKWENEGRPESFYVDDDCGQRLNAEAQEIKNDFINKFHVYSCSNEKLPIKVTIARFLRRIYVQSTFDDKGNLLERFMQFSKGATTTEVVTWMEDTYDVLFNGITFVSDKSRVGA
jgi:hypothetical protein